MLTRAKARQRALDNWSFWRLLLSDMGITYSDLDIMSDDDIAEANAALDIYIEQMKKENKDKK
ncbi:hypothetical protein KIH86_03665 [Paenibacillus sp. HN-1]|uniref:hypothetical protein n=1 Tax=Paenibacillus TaxID=44249 RepID=UPI001CA874E0|nr:MULTISPECIES: hypothetical protein [Paenibacillus]MBY9077280.1 hypothetical protein [Paenibacillus sp. CGMCC 1.18879]MBY9083327.1 hypothetical protein [Paenibacillus sinensis]